MSFCNHGASPHYKNSKYENHGLEGNLTDQKGAGLFGYTDLYGGYSGGQAEYARMHYADIRPRIVTDEMSDE